ncbi:sulfatase-like hydrolase/transferase [Niabella drilacis]|uniref:Arylsulfatase A n=1 Tax=Niabella drilacis (strain DSM 25811 / CCM 8410 / CCUG 62505 / LMG 26954 / E90) TaxID=1285928 RepID=A0A1G6IKF9_NIADE|nr:sulfatase-like hydrolase/transferase [Niabella drilacis]SDC06921.1 Arylsulfatase A [Niabella drilacis]
MKRIVFSMMLLFGIHAAYAQVQNRPNVLIIYTDDVGYGDLSCNGAKVIATPNIDRLAQNGINFSNAHATASTCTPSRYSLLSGRYAWRKKGTNILPGDANLVIPTDITTLPKVFQQAGYVTGAVGKWHLGLGSQSPVNWNKEVTPGPREVGFDYSFIFPATADRVPTVFMENQQTLGLEAKDPIAVDYHKAFPGELTGKAHPELLKQPNDPRQGHDGHIVNGIGRIGFMQGGKRSEWTDEELGYVFNNKALSFIDESLKKQKPFFLYYAIHNIHVPRMPGTEFKGKSKLGYRGDVTLEMDHSVGVIMNGLKERGLLRNTIVIFSSDNGPVLNDGYMDQSAETAAALDHRPGGIYRGGKYSAFEAGTRVPFIVQWPAKIAGGKKSDALVSQVDLMASFAAMLNVKLPAGEFTDSRNYFSTLTGRSRKHRDFVIEQPANSALCIIKDGWKYLSPSKGPALMGAVNIETGYSTADQLYDLNKDPGERTNLAGKYPQRVQALKALLEKVMAE